MKISKEVKRGMFQKLTVFVEDSIHFSDFNRIFMFLDSLYYMDKIIPYKIFENGSVIVVTPDGVIFEKWLEQETENISKDFNKGRKLVRLIKDLCENFSNGLAFTMGSEKVFMHMLKLFLLDLKKYSVLETKLLEEKCVDKEGLWLLRKYLALIFSIEVLSNTDRVDELLYLFLTTDGVNDLMDKVKLVTIDYFNNQIK